MNVHLPFGATTVPVDVPDNWINGRCFRSFRLEAAEDPAAALAAALDDPVGLESVGAVVKGRKNCVVVVEPAYPEVLEDFLPALLARLEETARLKSSQVTLLLTNSIWSPLDAATAAALVPSDIRKHCKVELHDPADASKCRNAGNILGEIPLVLNRAYLEADLKIVCGPVVPDMIFGYAGGRSLVVPGLAGEETLRALFSFGNVSNAAATYGSLQNNPFHAGAMQATMAAGCDLVVALLLAPGHRVSQVLAGDPGKTFLAATQRLAEKMAVRLKEPMDIAVTCGGGAPFDGTLYQTINALTAVEPILKPDGTIILAAELAAGFGPDPLRQLLLETQSPAGFQQRFGDGGRFVPGQWAAQRLFRLLENHEVLLCSQGLSEDEIWAAGLTPVDQPAKAIEVAMQEHGQRCKICALPDGPFSLAGLQGSEK